MSILIKGMEMPKSCFDCPFMYGRRYCRVNSRIEFNDSEYSELKGRYDGCPLVSVPPHGRLIDADAVLRRYDYELSRTYTDDFAKGFQLGVKAAVGNGAAVIIPTEEGE